MRADIREAIDEAMASEQDHDRGRPKPQRTQHGALFIRRVLRLLGSLPPDMTVNELREELDE